MSTTIELAPVRTSIPPQTISIDLSKLSPKAEDPFPPIDPSQALASSKRQTAAIITCITCSTAIGTFLAGVSIVALPTIIGDLSIPPGLALWPVSINALTCGCTLLLCGTLSDVLGSRLMYLTGCFLQALFTLSCGLARLSSSSTQLIVFRALGGIAASFCLPSAVSLINQTFPPGPRRNAAFAAMGGGQPIGFGFGITLGGVITDRLGWQWGFYFTSVFGALVLGFSWWQLPSIEEKREGKVWSRVKAEIDWVGVGIASSSLALLSYVLA